MGILEQAIGELRRWQHCPGCDRPAHGTRCTGCGLLLADERTQALAQQSEAAARALELRQRMLFDLIASSAPAVTPKATLDPGLVTTPTTTRPPTAPPSTRRTEVNAVAVLSRVGVGALLAAALVFAYLVPADPGLVRVVLLGVTAIFAVATLALRVRRPVSAAALATGTALSCLLLVALFVRPLLPEHQLFGAAVGTGGLALGFTTAGLRLRLRPWVSAGILLAPIAALLLAGAVMPWESIWWIDAALISAIALAAGGRWAASRWQRAQPGPMPFTVERVLLGLGAGFTLLCTVGLTIVVAAGAESHEPVAAALMLAAAGAAWVQGTTANSGWRHAAGMIAVLVPLVGVLSMGGPLLLAAPAAGLGWLALVAASGLPALRDGRWSGLLTGGLIAALLFTVPAIGVLLTGLASVFTVVTPQTDSMGVAPGWELPDAGFAVLSLLVTTIVCVLAVILPASRFGHGPASDPTSASERPGPPGDAHPSALHSEPVAVRASRWLWPWLGIAGLTAAALLPAVPSPVSVALLVLLACGCGLVAWRADATLPAVLRTRHGSAKPIREAARCGGGLVILAAAATSWDSRPLALAGGAAVVLLVAGWTRLVPLAIRTVLTGLGYGYALTLLDFALHWSELVAPADEWAAVPGLLAVVASGVSLSVLAATGRRLAGLTCLTVLGIGLLPWLLAIGTMLVDRTWWAAAATASMFLVAVALTHRSRPQPTWLRVLAAASLLPIAALVVINAGAVLLPVSGSPILLPIVAALAAVTAMAARRITRRIAGIDISAARPIRAALEGGALLTAVVSAGLAIGWPVTGADTTLLVCAILAAGGAVVARRPDRHWVWFPTALAAAGVLWSALTLLQVGLVEAYTVPLGVAALVAGARLARRQVRWWTLAAAGSQLALLPTWLLAATGHALLVRAAVLAGAALLLVITVIRLRHRAHPAAQWILAGGLLVSGSAPGVVAVHSSDLLVVRDEQLITLIAGLMTPVAQFGWVVAMALVSAAFLGVAGQTARWAAGDNPRWRRWMASWRFAPALTLAALGPIWAVQPDRHVVVAMWLACLAFLALTLAGTWLRLRGRVILPPVWFCWLLALGVGIAGWSLRELRVEAYALPLGLTLLACGVLAWRAARPNPGSAVAPASIRPTSIWPTSIWDWPIGQSNPTWAILPGVLATLGPSTLAIGTDPQTWRAILVLALALAALLVGARQLWRSVLKAGIVDLGVAVLLVFVARQGAIDAVPWLIALVSAGGVLLGLAVYSERRQRLAVAPT